MHTMAKNRSFEKTVVKVFNDFLKPYKSYSYAVKDTFSFFLAAIVLPLVVFFTICTAVIWILALAFYLIELGVKSLFALDNHGTKVECPVLTSTSSAFLASLELICTALFGTLMIPTLLFRIPLRIFFVYKQGWPNIWENRGLQKEVSKYSVALETGNTEEITASQAKIEQKLVKYFNQGQLSASRYIKIKTSSDQGSVSLTKMPPFLILRMGVFNDTVSDLETQITNSQIRLSSPDLA